MQAQLGVRSINLQAINDYNKTFFSGNDITHDDLLNILIVYDPKQVSNDYTSTNFWGSDPFYYNSPLTHGQTYVLPLFDNNPHDDHLYLCTVIMYKNGEFGGTMENRTYRLTDAQISTTKNSNNYKLSLIVAYSIFHVHLFGNMYVSTRDNSQSNKNSVIINAFKKLTENKINTTDSHTICDYFFNLYRFDKKMYEMPNLSNSCETAYEIAVINIFREIFAEHTR